MQVNLLHHQDAFTDMEAAFNPVSNTQYAASFLKKLKVRHRSWARSVGYYHSKNAKFNEPYRRRVMTTWRGHQFDPPPAWPRTRQRGPWAAGAPEPQTVAYSLNPVRIDLPASGKAPPVKQPKRGQAPTRLDVAARNIDARIAAARKQHNLLRMRAESLSEKFLHGSKNRLDAFRGYSKWLRKRTRLQPPPT